MMVICYAGDIIEYDSRTSERLMSNAAIHFAQDTLHQYRQIAI